MEESNIEKAVLKINDKAGLALLTIHFYYLLVVGDQHNNKTGIGVVTRCGVDSQMESVRSRCSLRI
jgi:hypothetical protein